MRLRLPAVFQQQRTRFGVVVLLAAALLVLAYQVAPSMHIAVGGDLAERRRSDDEPFLFDVNGAEPADFSPDPADPDRNVLWWEVLEGNGGEPYRWTRTDSTLLVPGLGGEHYLIDLRAAAGSRPDGANTPVTWQLADGQQLQLDLPPAPRRYQILAPTDSAGDLRVQLQSAPFPAPNDPRELGFVLYDIQIAPTLAAIRMPAWPQVAALLLILSTIAICAAAFAVPTALTFSFTSVATLAAALALAFARPALTTFTPVLLGLALFALAVAAGTSLWIRRARSADDTARFVRQVMGLVLLAFVLRMAGMLHPHAIYSDSGFHANKLFTLVLGQLFQSATLPAEAGGGVTPYPTGAYLLLAPGALLLPAGPAARVLLLQSGTALLDSLHVAAIAFLLVRSGLGRVAALAGAACYLLPITALESFAVGELANLAGQALAMPWILLLALGLAGPYDQSPRRTNILLIAALCMGLLAHSGVTLSLGAFSAALWSLAWLARIRAQPTPIEPLRLSMVAAIGLGLVIIGYYSAPPYLGGLIDSGGATGARAGTAPGELAAETVLGVLGVVPPRNRGWALPIALGVSAIAGMLLLWRQRRQAQSGALWMILAAYWLGMLITQGLLLIADQGVRWSIFLYPALCISAGVLLGRLWKQEWYGRLLAGILLIAIQGYGVWMWIIHIRDYFHR